MKIQPINNMLNKPKNFGPVAFIWGVTSVLMGATVPIVANEFQIKNEQAKKEIQLKAPERYERISALPKDSTSFFNRNNFSWTREANIMNDSLRIDSLIQKAYFDGAQMVRDSINNANKK